ncbi:MAG: hypothetical protein PHI34_07615, partial [Acidobacteriota bacterium]|nr:hypothetical protein [Acidobacteriota bacterium]
PANLRLARAVAAYCGADEAGIAAGLAAAAPDFGSLKAWRLRIPGLPPASCAVSLFAANEPESTALSLDRFARIRTGLPARRVAVLALRADRADRTRQWLEAADKGFFDGYAGVAAVGDHAHPIGRRLRRTRRFGASVISVPGADPARITEAAARLAGGASCLIGMGNIVGVGAALVEHWAANGEAF